MPRLIHLSGLLAAVCCLTSTPTSAQTEATANTVRLHVEGGAGADTALAVLEALRAQLVPHGLEVEAAPVQPEPADDSERLRQAMQLARAPDTRLVVWLSIRGESWLLYTLDPRLERLQLRPIDAGDLGASAAVEAVGVIARDAALALEGRGPAPPQPAPKAPSQAPPPPSQPAPAAPAEVPTREEHGLWLAVSYRGQNFADALPWESGLVGQVAWRTPWSDLLGVGVTWFPESTVSGSVPFSVQRQGLSLWYAWRIPAGPGWLDVSAAGLAETSTRHSFDREGVIGASPASKTRLGLAAGTRFHLPVHGPVGLFAAVDVVFYITNFGYRVKQGDSPLLSPRRLSPRASLGACLNF